MVFNFNKNLYISADINNKKLDIIIKKLCKNKFFPGVYLITIASNNIDQLDIISTTQFVQPFYKEYIFNVVGISSNYNQALSLIEKMVNDCINVRNDCNIKEYLSC